MPGKLVVILTTSRPITITAEHVSMRTKGRTARLASLDQASLGLESIIDTAFGDGIAIDGGAMRRRSDCDLLCVRKRSRAPPTRADEREQEYCLSACARTMRAASNHRRSSRFAQSPVRPVSHKEHTPCPQVAADAAGVHDGQQSVSAASMCQTCCRPNNERSGRIRDGIENSIDGAMRRRTAAGHGMFCARAD